MSVTTMSLEFRVRPSLVGDLQDRMARQFKVQVADCRDTCRDLAEWEDRYLVESPSPTRLSEHALMLDELQRVGEWIAGAVNQPGFDDPQSSELIGLTLQELRDSRALWHGRIPESRRKEILRDCLNES